MKLNVQVNSLQSFLIHVTGCRESSFQEKLTLIDLAAAGGGRYAEDHIKPENEALEGPISFSNMRHSVIISV